MVKTYWLRHRGGNRRTASSPCTTTASKCRPDRRWKILLTTLSASRSRTDPTYWENWQSLYTLTPITEKQIKFHVLKWKKKLRCFYIFTEMKHFLHVSWNISYLLIRRESIPSFVNSRNAFLKRVLRAWKKAYIRIQIWLEDHHPNCNPGFHQCTVQLRIMVSATKLQRSHTRIKWKKRILKMNYFNSKGNGFLRFNGFAE